VKGALNIVLMPLAPLERDPVDPVPRAPQPGARSPLKASFAVGGGTGSGRGALSADFGVARASDELFRFSTIQGSGGKSSTDSYRIRVLDSTHEAYLTSSPVSNRMGVALGFLSKSIGADGSHQLFILQDEVGGIKDKKTNRGLATMAPRAVYVGRFKRVDVEAAAAAGMSIHTGQLDGDSSVGTYAEGSVDSQFHVGEHFQIQAEAEVDRVRDKIIGINPAEVRTNDRRLYIGGALVFP
jgi:hypothetical protein